MALSFLVVGLLCFVPSLASPPLVEAPSDTLVKGEEEWRADAVDKLWKERELMKYTPLVDLKMPGPWKARIMLKNESASRTESVKHRYAWALFMWALLEGHVGNDTRVFEASSGNSACSEAYMARLLGVNYTAIVPDTLETSKEERIRKFGAEVIRVPIGNRLTEATRMAKESGGFFMNQFANADRAEEFHSGGMPHRESTNVFYEITQQLEARKERPPSFFVHSAGTGGTISSVGRFAKKYNLPTKVVLADTEFSVYADYVLLGRFRNESGQPHWVSPGMAGIGYGSMGAVRKGETSSLDRAVIDEVYKVPDIASTAAMRVMKELGIAGGTSTGIDILSALSIAAKNNNNSTLIVTVIGDNAVYYSDSYYDTKWIASKFAKHGGLEAYECWTKAIRHAIRLAEDPIETGRKRCATKSL